MPESIVNARQEQDESLREPPSIVPGVLVLNFDPIIRSEGNRRLHEALGWQEPRRLAEAYIAHLAECSGGYVRYQIAEWVDVDTWPTKLDGFRYDEGTFLQNWRSGSGWHQPDAIDYEAIMADWDLLSQVEAGQIDEVWLFGFPYSGFYESIMVGRDAFWCNAPPMPRTEVSRRFVIMGFSYERGVGPMLESFGHRVESILEQVYASWEPTETSPWDRFIQYDKKSPGWAGCGWMHYAPNSLTDFDWGNRQFVWSTCDDWLNYPDLRGKRRQVNCEEWGDGDMLAHHLWWLRHLPHAPGRSQGVLNNWWAYAVTLRTKDAAALGLRVTPETLPRDGYLLLGLLEQYAASRGAGRLFRGRQEQEKTEMRRAIAQVLGELGDDQAVDSLVELLQDREAEVRMAAVQALGQIGGERAVDALNKAATADADARVRGTATAALNQTDPLPHVGRIFANQYEIHQEMEPGGLTAAYRAQDIRLGREVVLKVVKEPPDTPTFLPAFEREADTFARLQHPNLVRVLGYNVTWPRPFYDREPVGDERTLSDLLAERGRLSVVEALPILEQVASALDYLHGQEPPVFHLHLKPAHVLLAEEGDTWQAVLTDSIPTRVWQASQTGDLVGTPGYISPEMAQGKLDAIGPRTDVYGLGLIAYEMLTGHAPFEGYTPLAVAQAHAEEPPPSPQRFAPELSEGVSAVLLRGLAKSPAERYPSAGSFVAALGSRARVEALVDMAQGLAQQGLRERALETAREALGEADKLPDTEERVEALSRLSRLLDELGEEERSQLPQPAGYLTCQLTVDLAGERGGRIARLQTPSSEAQEPLALDLNDLQLISGLQALHSGRLSEVEAAVLGNWLFERLLPRSVGRLYAATLEAARNQSSTLRILLDVRIPELLGLPWEMLHDGRQFLALQPDISLLRYVPQAEVPLPLAVEEEPLRILVVVPAPVDQPPLDLTKSTAALLEGLADLVASGQAAISLLESNTRQSIQNALREGYHVLHYEGHRVLDEQGSARALLLENEQGGSDAVGVDALVSLLSGANLRLVVLNADESAYNGLGGSYASLAQTLVQTGTPVVVGIQFIFPEQAALAFDTGFYRALAAGYPVDLAVAQGRRAVVEQAGGIGWAAPVVFSRLPDCQAFTLAAPQPEPQFWFVTANPEQYDWDQAFAAGRVQWTEVRGGEALANLRRMRPGDAILAYRSSPDRYITGLGRVAGEPYEYEDRHAVQIDANLKFETGVTLDELREATPDLQHVTRRRPAAISPVTAAQWTTIRELILYHNPSLSAEGLPPATVEPQHDLDIAAVELLDDLVSGQRAHLTLRLRNRGSLTWPAGGQILVTCDWQMEDNEEPRAARWQWLLEVSQPVPPGGQFETRDVGEALTLAPGDYQATWLAWGASWPPAAVPQRLIQSVRILAEAKTGLRVAVQTPDGLALRGAPSASAPMIGRLPYGQVLDVLDALQEGIDRVGGQDQWLHVRSPDGTEGHVAAWYVSLVGHWSADAIARRLSSTATAALRYAEAFRRAASSGKLDTPHLLAGLYQESEGPARRLLTLFDDEATARANVEEWANWPTRTELPLAGVEPLPEGPLPSLTFSPNAEKALLQAASLAEEKNARQIGTGYLLAGLLAVPESLAAQRIADLLQADRERLQALLAQGPDAQPPLDEIRAISARAVFLTHDDVVASVAFGLEGQMLASGSVDGVVRLWDLRQGRMLNTLSAPKPVCGVALPPDAARLFVITKDGTFQVLSLLDGDVTTIIPTSAMSEAQQAPPSRLLTAAAFSPGGALLATGFVDGTIQVQGLPQFGLQSTFHGHTGEVNGLAFAPDEQSLVSASSDRTLRVWDVIGGQEQQRLLGHREGVNAVAVTPDGKWVVSGSYDRSVKIWDLQTGRELLTLYGHDGPLLAVAVAFERRWVISGAADATLRIWDLDTGRPLATLRGHGGDINAVAVSPGGRTVASGSNDHSIRLWDLDEVAAGLPQPIRREDALKRIELVLGDLLSQPVDALVNAVGTDPDRAGAIGQRIAQELGSGLYANLAKQGPLALGQALVSNTDGRLAARYIIHPCNEEKRGRHSLASVAVGSAAAIYAAEGLPDVRTIAFPSMGTGAAGLAPTDVAPQVLQTVVGHLEQGSRLERVLFAFTDVDTYRAYAAAYRALGGLSEPPEWLGRLSTSSRRALRLAEALRQGLGADLLTTEHLLWGLYQKAGGATRLLLTTFDGHEQIVPLLANWLQLSAGIPDLQPVPESALADILLDLDCQRAMEEAARLPTHDNITPERHLLAGLLAVPQSRAAQWIADTLGLIAAQLEFVAREWRGQEEITILPDLVRRARRTYALLLGTRSQEATAGQAAEFAVGQHLTLHVDLLPGVPGSQNAFELPEGISELYCFLADAAGLHITGSAVAALPLALLGRQSPRASFFLQARLPGPRPYVVELFGEQPDRGGQALAQAGGQVTIVAPQAAKGLEPLQPILDLRVAAKPDLVLLVETALPEGEGGLRRLTYRLTCRLPGLRRNNEEVGQVTLQPADLTHIQALVYRTVAATTGLQPEDVRARMYSLGRYLFDRLFPADEAAAFRETLWQAQEFWQSHERPGQLPPTWLIVQEEATWLPWELITPYRLEDEGPVAPLAELYRLGRWVEGLGQTLYGEVPLGDKVLTHYKVLTPKQAESDEELQAWHQVLDAGIVADTILPATQPETNYYGLHLLRHAAQIGQTREIMVRAGTLRRASAEDEARRRRLDLHQRRPVVTLSILDGQGPSPDAAGDDWLLPERVLPFLRAGASAVLGPWWPTSEAADREFWATFYGYLAGHMPLGEAVWRARYAVQRKYPDRPDWLAYTLLGDPRARPYVPEKSEGYTALECLNAEDDGTLRPGKTYTFRASIQRRPPTWHQGRLVHAEELPKEPMVLFIVPGLQQEIPDPLAMTPTGQTLVQALYDLTPQEKGEFSLIARFMDGDERLQTLRLSLVVQDLTSQR